LGSLSDSVKCGLKVWLDPWRRCGQNGKCTSDPRATKTQGKEILSTGTGCHLGQKLPWFTVFIKSVIIVVTLIVATIG
jgi:hypothetical protein